MNTYSFSTQLKQNKITQYCNNNIPIVIFHIGNQDYLKKCLEFNSKNNRVFLLGTSGNKEFININNVIHIDVNKLNNSSKVKTFQDHFINFSSNPHDAEFLCFLRIFYIYQFMTHYNIKRVFHLDSDCVILKNINDISFNKNVAYSYHESQEKHKMRACIHNGLLTYDFCQKFIDLCFDIYVNKTKLHLIKPIIEYFFQNDIDGGVSDMVLFYLLRNNVQNLNIPFDGGVFMHNLNIGEGWLGKSQYELMEDLSGNYVIKITKKDNEYQIYDIINKKYYNLYSIHFQGQAKKHLRNIDTFLT
jgi:hypothetical protein